VFVFQERKARISERKKQNELSTNNKSKNVRELYRGINEFKIYYPL
jgi:hypothetical protein